MHLHIKQNTKTSQFPKKMKKFPNLPKNHIFTNILQIPSISSKIQPNPFSIPN